MVGQLLGPGPFVGRGAELARLQQRVEEALSGANACAWVVGDDGIGKTRLVHEIATYARLRGVVVRWLGLPEFESAGREGPGGESLPSSGPGTAELVVIDGVETAAAHTTAVEQLTVTTGTSRLVLGTSRRPPPDPIATILGERSADLLVLGGLEANALGRLLDALSGEILDLDLIAAIVRATQGNPARARSWLTRQLSGQSASLPELPADLPTPPARPRRQRPRP